MIFKSNNVIISESSIRINTNSIKISCYEFLNSSEKQEKILASLHKKTVTILLKKPLESYSQSILTIFQNNDIAINKIITSNSKIIYRKKKNHQYILLCLLSLCLIISSHYLSITKQTFDQIHQNLCTIAIQLQTLISNQIHYEDPIFMSTSTLLEWLRKKPILIQNITIKPPKTILFLIFSYTDITASIMKQGTVSINQLSYHPKGSYYELTYTF